MFYTFRQNNSGGSFVQNNKVGIYVIIEADSNKQANNRAEEIGIYFNGCDDGIDCNCCGDRWSRQYEEKGDIEPKIYDKTIKEYKKNIEWASRDEEIIHIYYKTSHKKICFDAKKQLEKNKAKKRQEAEKIWGISLSSGGLYSKTPIRLYYHEALKTYYDKTGNYSIKQKGLTKNDMIGTLFYFASENKQEVENFIIGAEIIINELKKSANEIEKKIIEKECGSTITGATAFRSIIDSIK